MKERSIVFIFLLIATWLFFFFNMSSYGLYEDDYNVVGGFVDKSSTEVFAYIKAAFTGMTQGRPFAYAFPAFITLIGVHLTDNLIMIYSTGLFFVFINSFLVYLLLRKWLSLPASLIGALIFLLTPADSAKILLTHNLILQPSVTCALLGIYFYCKQNKAFLLLSYLLGIISLLFYESGLLIFFFAPFFFRKPGNVLMKSIIIHVVVLAIVVFMVSLLRATGGESRVAELVAGSKLTLLLKIVSAPFIGLAGSGAAMLYGSWMGIKNIIGIQLIPVMIFGGLIIYWLKKFVIRNVPANNDVNPKLEIRLARWNFSLDHATYISITGILMILASYLLSFTHYPPIAISSRATSVHLASTIAWGVFLAAITEMILMRKGQYQLKQISIAFCGLILMFWASYSPSFASNSLLK